MRMKEQTHSEVEEILQASSLSPSLGLGFLFPSPIGYCQEELAPGALKQL